MSYDHSNRRILVTGAANGLGLGIARILAAAGARLVLADVDSKVRERAAEAVFSGRAVALVRDLAEPEAPRWLIEESIRELGSLNGLGNGGALGLYKPPPARSAERV